MGDAISRWLAKTDKYSFSVYAILVSFTAYFAMYAFRKPFAAGSFSEIIELFGHDFRLKTMLDIFQVVGYAFSKFLGIKVISEMRPSRRAVAFVALIAIAETALLVFAVVPPHLKLIALFFNGLPLGMIWGLVFSFLEGRRTSDALGAGLSASFIVASGAVKSVGTWLMNAYGVSESWMPFLTGLLFFPVILVAAWLLSLIPPPSPEEAALRTYRQPMNAEERRRFFLTFAPGLLVLSGMAMLLTAYRDVRDTFALEIWQGLGYTDEVPRLFTLSEIPVSIAVLVALGLVVMVKKDRRALLLQLSLMFGGMCLIGVSTLLYDMDRLSGVWWMTLIGIGLYVAYVPPGCFLFDRLIGATHYIGTAVFMIFVTDAVGYAASVGVKLYRELFQPNLDWLTFLHHFSYIAAIGGGAGFFLSILYFSQRTKEGETPR